MKLLYNQGNYAALCFPYGQSRTGGSCEFATKKCLKECSEQYGKMDWFKEVLQFFNKNNTLKIYNEIISEMKRNEFNLLYWFDCGDCPKNLTNKIAIIIEQLQQDNYVQLGFTRNILLWRKINKLDNVRFVLTVESINAVIEDGYYAIPDYKKAYTRILYKGEGKAEARYYCGGGSCYNENSKTKVTDIVSCSSDKSNTGQTQTDNNLSIHEANCQFCFNDKRGCFRGR